MHKTNSIIMHASRAEIFETAANLELWPKIFPHYRYIKYLERGTGRADHRRFFYSSHRQSHSAMHESISGIEELAICFRGKTGGVVASLLASVQSPALGKGRKISGVEF